MKKYKKIISIFLCFILLFSISISVFANGDDNAESGGGGTGSGIGGKGFYRSGEWMYKVSVYVGISDKVDTKTSLPYGYKMIGDTPIFVKPSSFSLPSGVIFGKYSKVNYIRGANLESNPNPKIVTDNPPPPPITNGGRIGSVKNYFGDTLTLKMLLTGFAEQKGTTREGLVKDIEFTINGKKGKQDPKNILPVKDGDKYLNKVPWVIIYEPVTIAHLKDKKTKLAFTATEYALAQQSGAFDFFYSGSQAQHIAGMTHSNLPNSVVLEEGWLGYTAYPPLAPKTKWNNDRIIAGGGWGMRFLKANGANTEEIITPPGEEDDGSGETKNINIGDYRVDTDVITSFTVGTGERITPDTKATVTIYVDSRPVSTTDIVLPDGGSQLVWAKWHTPSTPRDMTVSASISGNSNAYFIGGSNKVVKIRNLSENVPPDPVAKDPKTGKPVQGPKGYKIPKLPRKAKTTTATWGDWSSFWKADWQWHEDWTWKDDYEKDGGKWVDNGKWVDEGDWEYFWNSYSASLSAEVKIKPDSKVPTAKQLYSDWEMKSGYGLNIEVVAKTFYDAPSSAITPAQNVINFFPEFNYDTYWRLSENMGGGNNAKFELKKNKYSTYNQRVHFTPLWFPDNKKYTTYSEVIDLWTPAGMLSIGLDDFINIEGNLFDDWRVVPVKP